MTNLIEAATAISEPLGLGGLTAAVFFLFLRYLVNKGLLPKVTRAVGARLLKDILQKLFYLSALAILLGFLGYIAALVVEDRKRSSGEVRPQTVGRAEPVPTPNVEPQLSRVLTQVYAFRADTTKGHGPVPFNFYEAIRSDEQIARGESRWIRTPNENMVPEVRCPDGRAAGRACILDKQGRLTAYLRESCDSGDFEGPKVLSGCSTAHSVFGKQLDRHTPLVQCCFYEDSPAAYDVIQGAAISEFTKAVAENKRRY